MNMLPWCPYDAGVNDLSTPRKATVFIQFPIGRFKNGFADSRRHQAFTESPESRTVRDLAALA